VTPKCGHWWEGAEILKIETSRVGLKVGHSVVVCKMNLKDRKNIRSEYILIFGCDGPTCVTCDPWFKTRCR
jgi:hypothetical protein